MVMVSSHKLNCQSVGLSLPVEMMRGGKQEVMIGWVRAVVDEPVDVGGFVVPSWNG